MSIKTRSIFTDANGVTWELGLEKGEQIGKFSPASRGELFLKMTPLHHEGYEDGQPLYVDANKLDDLRDFLQRSEPKS